MGTSHKATGIHVQATTTLKWCTGINAIYLMIEAYVGMRTDSLSLLADACYNLGDLLVLALAYLSLRSTHSASDDDTYRHFSHERGSAWALAINVAIMLISAGIIIALALSKLALGWYHCTAGVPMLVTALAGIAVNGVTATLLFRSSGAATGVKNAFVSMAADTFVSLVVAGAGLLLVMSPASTLADPVAAIIAALITIWFTIRLLLRHLR